MNKQIEEMAKVIFESSHIPSVWRSDAVKFAEALYNAGYRKASDVVREILSEVCNAWSECCEEMELKAIFEERLGEILKKYESEEADDDL